MVKRVKSNLKYILASRKMSIRQLVEATKPYSEDGTGVKFETLRRLYNDTAQQYQRDTIGIICDTLNIKIEELLELEEKDHRS